MFKMKLRKFIRRMYTFEENFEQSNSITREYDILSFIHETFFFNFTNNIKLPNLHVFKDFTDREYSF